MLSASDLVITMRSPRTEKQLTFYPIFPMTNRGNSQCTLSITTETECFSQEPLRNVTEKISR